MFFAPFQHTYLFVKLTLQEVIMMGASASNSRIGKKRNSRIGSLQKEKKKKKKKEEEEKKVF